MLSCGFRAAPGARRSPRTCTWRCQDRTKPMAVRVAIVDQRIEARAECTRDGMDWEESHAEYYTDQGHHRGEYRVLNVKATIALDGQQVGRIELILVDRDVRGVSFHEMCDSESAELVDVAFALFDRDGFTPRL